MVIAVCALATPASVAFDAEPPQLRYTGDAYWAAAGHRNEGSRAAFRDLLDLRASFPGDPSSRTGSLFFGIQSGHGRGPSGRSIDVLQNLSNIEADGFAHLSELWWGWRRDGFDFRVGKQDAGAELGALALDHAFLHSSFGTMPTFPAPTFPAPATGAIAYLDLSATCVAGAGIFDGAPADGTTARDGFFRGSGGRFAAAQLVWQSGDELAYSRLLAGGWHQHAARPDLAESSRSRPDNHGALFVAEHTWNDGTILRRGGMFLQLAWAPEDRNEIAGYLGTGFLWYGPWPRRRDDLAGLGFAWARTSPESRDGEDLGREAVLEVFYRLRLGNHCFIQPDLQYVFLRCGDDHGALAVGFRTEIVF